MVHSAFDCVLILKACPVKIESAGLWGARFLLGCIDGSLRIYAPEDAPDALSAEEEQSSATAPSSYALRDKLVGFTKKAVVTMDVLQSRGLLITLSDAVTVHTLPEFEVVSYLTKTKGATLYAWDEDRGLLAVARQKRIYVYRFEGKREFVEMKELTVADTVKAMAWSNESLCLGIRREYVIMNITSGTTVDVFPCGRISGPLIVSLPQGDLLLGKDNIGVIVDHNGKLKQEGGFSWSEAPATVVIHSPYALARLSRFIEIRSLRPPHGLVQMLSLRDINLLLTSDAGLVAASDYAIYRILPVPLSVQVAQLAASGNFEDALALCKLLPPEDAALRAAKEDSIHIRYGYYLFEQSDYVEAMEHFGASSLDLVGILSLFPFIRVPKLISKPISESSSEENNWGTQEEKGSSGPSLDRLGSANDTPAVLQSSKSKPEDNEDFQDTKLRKKAISALSGFLMSKRGPVTEKAEAEETDAAVAAMVESAEYHDHQPAGESTDVSDENQPSSRSEKRSARELATVLDTAVVQTLLAMDHLQGALNFLRGPNYCDVSVCEEIMLEGGHYLELIELYRGAKMHREALQLLNRLAEKPGSFTVPPPELQFGAQNIVDYAMTLRDQDPMLILESSNWVLQNNPDQALLLFSSFSPPLPANLVLVHLKERAPELRVFYLENMLSRHTDGSGTPTDLQSELMHLYLTRVLEEKVRLEAQGKWDERAHNEDREKLLKALQNSRAYSPERMLKRLPPNCLYQERAYLLGQLGQHQLALTLYVHELHEPEHALAYCDRVYNLAIPTRKSSKTMTLPPVLKPTEKAAVNVYLTLLEVYLKPKAAVKAYNRSLASLAPVKSFTGPRPTNTGHRGKRQISRKIAGKIAKIEGAEESKYVSSDGTTESGLSDTEDPTEDILSSEGLMLDDALGLLSSRWDRFDGSQALHMLPPDTKLQKLLPFLEPMLRTSSEAYRNFAVIKSLHRSENLQVREELLSQRRRGVKINSDRTCFICQKRIGTSVFAVYPHGSVAHFVCHRDRHPTPAEL